MNISTDSQLPPADFVSFLAERAGLSHEAAEHRLENWFGEYYASASERSAGAPSSIRSTIAR